MLFKNKRTNSSVFFNPKKGKGYKNFGKNDTLNIAVLLPFYTTKNYSLLSFLSESQQSKEDIYKDSYLALNYLEGVIIATDSLNKIGLNINLFVYDTENDTNKVQELIEDGKLKNIDFLHADILQLKDLKKKFKVLELKKKDLSREDKIKKIRATNTKKFK